MPPAVRDILLEQEYVSGQKSVERKYLMSTEDLGPEVAVTGDFWLGRGLRSIWTLVRDCISKAESEIQIAAYAIGENSDEYEFFELLRGVLARGIRVLMIVNRFSNQRGSVRDALLELAGKYPSFALKSFNPRDKREDLHAKLIVVDHTIALVGSANLSFKGMVANHEVMVKLSGKTAYSVGELLDRLSANSETIQEAIGR
jgi:phosphatidylserine/phosphatidylglycerophosphate/cardiolipin synthase-like enzyme